MNTKFLFLTLFFSIAATSQTNPFTSKVDTGFSFSRPDTLRIVSLNMLGKFSSYDLQGNELPSDYKWTRDVRRTEALKRFTLQQNVQDPNGRELPPDVFKVVRNEALWRSRESE